jgi:hypothetical protein
MRRPGWRNPFGGLVDDLVAGPGENPLAVLLGGDAAPVHHIPPDYSSLPLREYLSPGLILPYSAAGGCWWSRCTFCPERAEGNDYRPLPTHQVLTDLRLLTESTSPVLIHLLDNAISPALLRALAENPPGVPWYGFARIDERLADPDFCRALKRSGWVACWAWSPAIRVCWIAGCRSRDGFPGALQPAAGRDRGLLLSAVRNTRGDGARGQADAGVCRPAPRGDRVSQSGRLHDAARLG